MPLSTCRRKHLYLTGMQMRKGQELNSLVSCSSWTSAWIISEIDLIDLIANNVNLARE